MISPAIIVAVGVTCFVLGWLSGFMQGRFGRRGGIQPTGERPSGPPPTGGGTGPRQ
ncbi:MAG: hypothetical protein ACREH4_01335 [Vitreimonas sp.]